MRLALTFFFFWQYYTTKIPFCKEVLKNIFPFFEKTY